MCMNARQSTARSFIVGPILDASGVAVTDGVIADLKLSKNGAAPAAFNGSATLTHRHTGFYSLAATATDLDTIPGAQVTIDDGANTMPPLNINVIEEAVFDALFAASAAGYSTYAGGDTSGVTTLLSRLSATRAGYLDNLSAGAAALETSLQGLITTIGASAAGVATAVWGAGTRTLTAFDSGFKTGYALSSAGVQAIWDALTSALTTSGSIGKFIIDSVASILARQSVLPTKTGAVVDDALNSASAFKTDLTGVDDDHYKDCLLKFTGGALAGQSGKKITASDGTTGFITVSPPFTAEPAAADPIEIIDD